MSAELTAKAEVFDVVAVRLMRLAGGNYLALFGLCVVFASATTIFLNLDTTAVLLTPVMFAKADIPSIPPAMLTVWLTDTANLLLPVSNLTNLLAIEWVGLAPTDFAARIGTAGGGDRCHGDLSLGLLLTSAQRSRGGRRHAARTRRGALAQQVVG